MIAVVLQQALGGANHLRAVVHDRRHVLDHHDIGAERNGDRRHGEVQVVAAIGSPGVIVEVGVTLARWPSQNCVDLAHERKPVVVDQLRLVDVASRIPCTSDLLIGEFRSRTDRAHLRAVIRRVHGHGAGVLVDGRFALQSAAHLTARLAEAERKASRPAEQFGSSYRGRGRRVERRSNTVQVRLQPATTEVGFVGRRPVASRDGNARRRDQSLDDGITLERVRLAQGHVRCVLRRQFGHSRNSSIIALARSCS